MNSLLESAVLQNDQKLNILNQYVLPKLTYPLQAAPIHKIPKNYPDAIDVTIRQTAKGIIGLPIHNTPNSMLYTARKYRSLGLVCARSEVILQHYAIASKLLNVEDELFHSIYDCGREMADCKETLEVNGQTTRQLRSAYRDKEFEKWRSLQYGGVGVKHYAIYPKSNRFVSSKNGLSCSEWTAAIKLNCNYANLNGVPGVQRSNRQCHRCNVEIETISHVLGNCAFGSNLRTARHHSLKHKIAQLLRTKGYQVFDEVFCQDNSGSNRFVDILAFSPATNEAFIIDPTVRWENNLDMDSIVEEEKTRIYQPCIDDLKRRYTSLGERVYEVMGIWMGTKSTIGQSMVKLLEKFDLDRSLLPELAERTLVESLRMVHHHIYAS